MQQVKEFRFDYHGVDHAQYFPGVSTVFTLWTAAYVGIGETPQAAADDALEVAMEDDIAITDDMSTEVCQFSDDVPPSLANPSLGEESELSCYVVLWVKAA